MGVGDWIAAQKSRFRERQIAQGVVERERLRVESEQLKKLVALEKERAAVRSQEAELSGLKSDARAAQKEKILGPLSRLSEGVKMQGGSPGVKSVRPSQSALFGGAGNVFERKSDPSVFGGGSVFGREEKPVVKPREKRIVINLRS